MDGQTEALRAQVQSSATSATTGTSPSTSGWQNGQDERNLLLAVQQCQARQAMVNQERHRNGGIYDPILRRYIRVA